MKPPGMGPSALLLTLLLAALAAQAQAPDRPFGTATLEGTVVNSQNSRPVPRAQVFVHSVKKHSEWRSVHADGQGRFIVQHLAAGSYQVIADQINYFSDPRRRSFQPTFQLAEGERKDILVQLLPAGVVTGQLVNESNDPMARASVKLLKRTVYQGRAMLNTVGLGLTDDRGEYRIYGVQPGRYYLLAEVSSRLQAKSLEVFSGAGVVGVIDRSGMQVYASPGPATETDVACPPVFFPDTRDFLQSQELPVGPGDEVHANFVMYTMPSVTIQGVVLNGVTGERAKNAAVAAYWTDVFGSAGGNINGTSKEDGTFEIRGVAPGIYTLRAAFSDESGGFTDEQTVEVGVHGRDAVTLAGLPQAHLDGQIVVESSDPARQLLPARNLNVMFSPARTTGDVKAVAKYPDFSLETRLRALERYTVSVTNLPKDFYLKSVRVSGHEVDSSNVMAAARDHIELGLSPLGGHVDGTVYDDHDQPAAGYVLLIPSAPAQGNLDQSYLDLFRNASSDEKGKFVLRGIPPGTYKLIAFEGLTPEELMDDPATLKDYQDRGETLMVSEGGKYLLSLKLIPSE